VGFRLWCNGLSLIRLFLEMLCLGVVESTHGSLCDHIVCCIMSRADIWVGLVTNHWSMVAGRLAVSKTWQLQERRQLGRCGSDSSQPLDVMFKAGSTRLEHAGSCVTNTLGRKSGCAIVFAALLVKRKKGRVPPFNPGVSALWSSHLNLVNCVSLRWIQVLHMAPTTNPNTRGNHLPLE